MQEKDHEIAPIDYYPGWGGWALKEEDILWTGKPSVKYNELRTEGTDASRNPLTEGFVNMLFVGIYAVSLFEEGDILFGVTILILALFYPMIRDYIDYYRIAQTKYAISKDFIIFKMWSWFKFRFHVIPYNQIVKVSLVEDSLGRGLIHLVTRDKMEFSTYEMENREKRDHPTLEYVENPKEAVQLIKSRIKPDPNRKLVYTPPTISFLTLRILRMTLNGLLTLFVIALFEFYKNGFIIDGLHHPTLWFAGIVLIFSRITLVRKFMISEELFMKIVILNLAFISLFLLLWNVSA